MAPERLAGQEVENTHTLVVPLADFRQANFRTDGLKKLHSAGLPIPAPIYVVPHSTFELYKEHPEPTLEALKQQLKEPAVEAASNSKKGSIAVRRAYDIPGQDNPRGRSFLGVHSDGVAEAIKALFDDAANVYGYDKIPNAQIACFFYPFIDPENKPLEEVGETDVLPYGGWLIPISEDGYRLRVHATWGNNQTLVHYNEQSRPLETYEVEINKDDSHKVIIHRKAVVPKTEMHYTSKNGKSSIVTVPITHQLQQVMWDSEIIETASYLPQIVSMFGPQRVEFSSDGGRIFFNESIDMKREVQQSTEILEIDGSISIVATMEDLRNLSLLSDEELRKTVIFAADTGADSEVNVDLARNFEGTELTILYAGVADLAHAMKVFLNSGHRAFATGQLEVQQGDRVLIKSDGVGKPIIENLTLSESKNVVSLSAAYMRGTDVVGGKAERLSYIKSRGYDIPNGIVLTTDFFDSLVKEFGVDELISGLISNLPGDPNEIEKAIRERVGNIPDSMWSDVESFLNRYRLMSVQRLIVRSSANVEDARHSSFAGMFESIHAESEPEDIKRAILECFYSAFSPKVIRYLRGDIEKLREIKLSMIVQELVDARSSGVIFGGDPRTKRSEVISIEAKSGLATEIVGGTDVELRFRMDKATGEIVTMDGPNILSVGEKRNLFRLTVRFEELFGFPQDIEWSIDKNNKLWIIQSRDL